MILATIHTQEGTIELDRETGLWQGPEWPSGVANATANLKTAKPEHGEPVWWAVQQVHRVLPGRVESEHLENYRSSTHKKRVY